MLLKRLLKKGQVNDDYRKRQLADAQPPTSMHDDSNWLVSYADMMTLLCGFFILLFSMAKLDEPEFDHVKKAVAKHFGGDYSTPTEELTKYMTQVIQELGIEQKVTLKSDMWGVELIFQSTVFFDTLSSEVKPEGKAVLNKLIEAIALRQETEKKQFRVVVEGHTDSRPIIGGVYPSNWELSGARAARVVRMFLDRSFAPERLTAIGYADTHPVTSGRTPAGEWDEEALAKNRRVAIRILLPKVQVIPLPSEATANVAH